VALPTKPILTANPGLTKVQHEIMSDGTLYDEMVVWVYNVQSWENCWNWNQLAWWWRTEHWYSLDSGVIGSSIASHYTKDTRWKISVKKQKKTRTISPKITKQLNN